MWNYCEWSQVRTVDICITNGTGSIFLLTAKHTRNGSVESLNCNKYLFKTIESRECIDRCFHFELNEVVHSFEVLCKFYDYKWNLLFSMGISVGRYSFHNRAEQHCSEWNHIPQGCVANMLLSCAYPKIMHITFA